MSDQLERQRLWVRGRARGQRMADHAAAMAEVAERRAAAATRLAAIPEQRRESADDDVDGAW